VKIIVTCNKSKTHKQQLILSFFFLIHGFVFFPLLLRFGSASLNRSILFFSFPILLYLRWRQDQGGHRLLGFGFLSCLCSCRWPVRVLAKTTAYKLLPFGWRGMSRSGWMACGAVVLWLVSGPVKGDEGKNRGGQVFTSCVVMVKKKRLSERWEMVALVLWARGWQIGEDGEGWFGWFVGEDGDDWEREERLREQSDGGSGWLRGDYWSMAGWRGKPKILQGQREESSWGRVS